MSKAKKRRNFITACMFMLPFFILYTVFTIWPVGEGVYVSLHNWSMMGKQKYVGLDNYTKFLNDRHFWSTLANTSTFVAITAPMVVVMSMIVAMLANRATRMKKALRIAYYLPSILSVSAASFIARNVYAPYTGLINGILHVFGILPSDVEIQWLLDLKLAWISVSTMTTWWTLGFSMMLFISALQDISREVYEAAAIDGATKIQILTKIEIPLIKSTTWLVFLLQMIASFKVFGQIYLITKGGPANATRPIIQYIYQTAFEKNKMGYAAAMSYVLFGILLVLTLAQQILQKRGEK